MDYTNPSLEMTLHMESYPLATVRLVERDKALSSKIYPF